VHKACTTCGGIKPLFYFPKNASAPDGRYSKCKPCRKEVAAAYRVRPEVREREAARLRAEYLNDRENKLARRKVRYANNREATLAQNRKWRDAHLEQHRELCRQWARDNPEKMRVIVANRRAWVAKAEGTHTAQDIARMLEEQGGFCVACRGDLQQLGYHVDHVHPISKGGSNGPENLQLLCPACNRSKSDKTDWSYEP